MRDDVLSIVRELGLPLIDTVLAFLAHNDTLALFPFRAPGDYTEAGIDSWRTKCCGI